VFPAQKNRQPVRAVDDVSFTIAPGETFGFLGPNGAGKTTTLRLVLGLLKPTKGQVFFDGKLVGPNAIELRQQAGIVTESAGIYNKLTCPAYLEFFARMYDMKPAEYKPRIAEMLKRFHLDDSTKRKLGGFSKGMKQKVNIVRALLHRPRLLILDEPTSGLDPEMTETVWEVLKELSADRSVSIILCTHNLGEAERLCDRVAILIGGRIVKEGRPDDLKEGVHGERLRRVKVVLTQLADELLAAVERIEGVQSVERINSNGLRIFTPMPAGEINPRIAKALVERGAELVSLQTEASSLREVYLRQVGGAQ
jgi:ABC-2 type transport system ATP-binding protein